MKVILVLLSLLVQLTTTTKVTKVYVRYIPFNDQVLSSEIHAYTQLLPMHMAVRVDNYEYHFTSTSGGGVVGVLNKLNKNILNKQLSDGSLSFICDSTLKVSNIDTITANDSNTFTQMIIDYLCPGVLVVDKKNIPLIITQLQNDIVSLQSSNQLLLDTITQLQSTTQSVVEDTTTTTTTPDTPSTDTTTTTTTTTTTRRGPLHFVSTIGGGLVGIAGGLFNGVTYPVRRIFNH